MIHDFPQAQVPPSFPVRTIRFGLAAMIALLLTSTFLTWRVGKGEIEKARAIIHSRKYDYLVDIYTQGVRAIEGRATRFIESTRSELNFYLWLIVAMSAASLILIVLGWFALIRPTRRWGDELNRARAEAEHAVEQLKAQQAELEQLNILLFEQARTDALTGLHTRLKFNEDVEQIWPRVDRHGESYCALMCDIDFFKQYNDSMGHLGGDTALRRVADALRSVCRAGDQLYRFGGEEFLIILNVCDIEGGMRSAEQYRVAVKRLAIAHAASPLGVVTLSIGVACLTPGAGQSLQSWLGEADKALYDAKANGRNRVETRELVAG